MNRTPQYQESKTLGDGRGALRGNTFLVNGIWFRTVKICSNGIVWVKNLTTGAEKMVNFKDLEKLKVEDVNNMDPKEQYRK